MDERLKFVARLLDGEKMAVLCREFEISRKTGHKVWNRYKDCGLTGLTDRCRQANQLPFQLENRLLINGGTSEALQTAIMTPKARKVLVAMLVVLVPLAIANMATVTTFVMNATVLPVGFERHADIPYGADGSLRLDVYVPTARERAAIVVFWHGGMWRHGSKDDVRFVGAALARSGFVAVVPNYRLYPTARYRDFLDDGAIAVAWTRRNAARFGGDADDLFLMGHSAGAYIASMLAFDERLLASRGVSTSCIDGMISLSGPQTFERPAVFLDEIFGKPREAGWRPLDVASENAPPSLLLHGYDDYVVWGSEPIAMAERLQSLNVPVELRLYEGRSHQDMLTAWSWLLQFRAPVRDDVVAFVDSTVTRSTRGSACNL